MRLPAPPPLAWKGIDLTAALACGLERVIGGQLAAWRRYGEELLTSWKRAGVRALIVYNDCTSNGRTRVLVAERLGVPSIVVQHGMLAWIGDRNHEIGDYSAVWGDLVVDDFAARGIAPDRVRVVGWPTANVRLPEIRRRGEAGSDSLALILTTDLPVGTALVPEDAVERASVGAIEAIRGAGWRGRVVAKIHPSQDSAIHKQLFVEAGHPDVEVYGGRTDPWPLMARANVVVTASTSIACALPHLGKSAVLYDLVRPPYAPYLARFSDFGDAATTHAAKEEVVRSIEGKSVVGGGMPCRSVVDYASEVRNADERFAEIVRRAMRQGPVAEGALRRALNADAVHPLAFDHLPIRKPSESLKS